MQRRFYRSASFGLLLLAATVARAQLRVEPAKFDFGTRPQNQAFTAVATLTNVSPGAVTILNVDADCGCTTGIVGSQQLAPGRSTTLTVRLETGAVEGPISHHIFLELAGGGRVIVPVSSTITHYTDWVLTPPRLLLPPSPRGAEAAAELRLDYLGAGRPKIVSAASSSPWLAVEPLGSPGPTTQRLAYSVRKLPDAPEGSLFANIRITTGDAASPILDVPVFAYVAAGIEVRPNPVVLPMAKAGAPSTATVRIFGWDGANPLRVELSGGDARVQERKSGEVVVVLTAASLSPGETARSLRLYDGKRLVLTVPVTPQAAP